MKHWCVPESFLLPKEANLSTGWRLWLTEAVHFDDSNTPWKVKPYRHLGERDMKCKAMKNDIKAWRGIYKLMESAATLPSDEFEINQTFVDSSFQTAYHFLKTNYSYIFFNTEDAKLAKQKIKTWCKKTRRSEVVKKGTDSDKAKLAPPGKLNSPHGQKRTFSVPNRRGPNKGAKRGSKKGSNVDSSFEL